jgi:hypothetical protein
MIVIDRPKLKFLLAGRAVNIDTPRRYKPGRTYPAGTNKTACRVQILETVQLNPRQWRLTIRQVRQEKPVYLAANPGAIRADYTENPAKAARNPDGAALEAVRGTDDTRWLAKIAERNAERDDLLRRERAHRDRLERRGRTMSS